MWGAEFHNSSVDEEFVSDYEEFKFYEVTAEELELLFDINNDEFANENTLAVMSNEAQIAKSVPKRKLSSQDLQLSTTSTVMVNKAQKCATDESAPSQDGNGPNSSNLNTGTTVDFALHYSKKEKAGKHSDDQIAGFSYLVVEAFNSGDLKKVNELIDSFCTEDFTLRTPFSTTDFCGRHHYREIMAAILADRPDTVYTVKYSKLLREKTSHGRYLAVKVEFSQTRCGFTSDKLDKLDEIYRPEVLKALKADLTIEEKQRTFVDHKIPYIAKGLKWFRYSVSDSNELFECSITRKFTMVEPFILKEE
jgi:hypothetical protein